MKKMIKLKGIVSKDLQKSYLEAEEAERGALRSQIEAESRWMIERMAAKGFQLEARVANVYGLFTRGAALGTVEIVSLTGATEPSGEMSPGPSGTSSSESSETSSAKTVSAKTVSEKTVS